ncbi:UNVERIFIED_CONTAM: hypothetical protein FKN15_040612 [Acipenser sinensis]
MSNREQNSKLKPKEDNEIWIKVIDYIQILSHNGIEIGHYFVHLAQPRHATPRHATPRHATPRHATPRHATPRHATPRHATPRHATPRHATPRHATPRHATPRHATPRHATPRHATPRHFCFPRLKADKRAKVKLEKARCLIGLLVEKGCAASGKCISKLAERDPNLYRTLRLHDDSEKLSYYPYCTGYADPQQGRSLCRRIPEFIKSTAVLKGLLKDMQEMKQLSGGEVEEVMKQESTRDRTSHLTSMVMRKGDAFRENFLSKLAERNPKFYSAHYYDLDPVDMLIQVQSQFVESVSDAVIEGLLKDMLEMKVLSDEDGEEVRDAPQNTGLQSWLVEQINSGRYPGLSWTNEALKQFRIPWKHDDQKDLTPEDTMIFKGWAAATGRYREGIDQPDPADWRRHFQRTLDKDESLVLRADHIRDPVDPHKIYWSEDILAGSGRSGAEAAEPGPCAGSAASPPTLHQPPPPETSRTPSIASPHS